MAGELAVAHSPHGKRVGRVVGRVLLAEAAAPEVLVERGAQVGAALERERVFAGNWKIRPAAGLYFKREWCAVVDAAPADLDIVRYWDLAATEKTQFNDPDWTVGVKLGRDRSGGY